MEKFEKLKEKKYALVILGVAIIAVIGYFIFGRYSVQSTQMKKQTPSEGTIPVQTQMKVEELVVGSGKQVKKGDTVIIHYTGVLTNGTVFDSSVTRGQPFETQIGVGKVIRGWDEGVVGMKVGGKRRLTIPPELAYGEQAVGPIPANSTLIFELELLNVK